MKLAGSGSPVDVYWVGDSPHYPIPWWRPRWQFEVTPAPEWGEPWAGRAYTNIGAYWRGIRQFRRWARRQRQEGGGHG